MGRWVCVVWGSIGDGVFVRSYGQDMLCFRSYPHKSTGVSGTILVLCSVDLFWAWCFKWSIILCAFIVMFWTADLLCGMNHAALHVSHSHFRSYNLVFFSGGAFVFCHIWLRLKRRFYLQHIWHLYYTTTALTEVTQLIALSTSQACSDKPLALMDFSPSHSLVSWYF